MPPACPVDAYVHSYKGPPKNPSFPHSAATASPSLRNGEKKSINRLTRRSSKHDAPPGKPVASDVQNAKVVSDRIIQFSRAGIALQALDITDHFARCRR